MRGIDLLHTRVSGDRHANGTIGGYTPAPPTDRHHPAWKVNGGPGDASSLSRASWRSRTAGSGGLRVEAGNASLQRHQAKQSLERHPCVLAPTRDRALVPSRREQRHPLPARLAHPLVGRNAGQGGYIWAGAGGLWRCDKRREEGRRRKCTPFRVDDDDELPEGYVNLSSQTYGSEKDIVASEPKERWMGYQAMVNSSEYHSLPSAELCCCCICCCPSRQRRLLYLSPRHAADPITAADQPYFTYYHLGPARAKGYTGKRRNDCNDRWAG